jgi:hypothetical protein
MPELVRLYVRHVLIGFALSGAFVAVLLWADVAHLARLVAASDRGWLAVAMLVVANGIVFSGVQFGIAVMRMADDETPPPGGRRQARPVQVPAVARSRPAPRG